MLKKNRKRVILLIITFLIPIGVLISYLVFNFPNGGIPISIRKLTLDLDQFSDINNIITIGNYQKIGEKGILKLDSKSPIVFISNELGNNNELLIVNQNGQVHQTNIDSGKILKNLHLGNDVWPGSVSYSNINGSYLLVPGGIIDIVETTPPDDVFYRDELIFNGYRIWDLEKEKIVECRGPGCASWGGRPGDTSPRAGFLLSPNENLLVDYRTTDVRWRNYVGTISDIEFDYIFIEDYHIGKVVFNNAGNLLALAAEEGLIQIHQFPEIKRIERKIGSGGSLVFGVLSKKNLSNIDNIAKNISDLKFSNTQNFLAEVWGNNIVIWDITRFTDKPLFSFQLQNTNVIEFSIFDDMLIAGTNEGLVLIDIKKQRIATNYPVGEVTQLLLSQDGTLLFWGDDKGDLHIWGIGN